MSFQFRKAPVGPVLSFEERERQWQVVRIAQAALETPDAVRDFLNNHHDGLDGRPLDLAIASDAGLKAVEAAIVARRPHAVS